MQFATFDVRNNDVEELNKFLRSHRVLSTSKMFNQIDGSWSFCVEYIPDANFEKDKEKNKVDYREILTAEDYGKYRALRDARAVVSKENNTPVYVIFTNSDLSLLVEKEITPETLMDISGFGKQKFDKYGARFIASYKDFEKLIPQYIEEEKARRAKNEAAKQRI